MEQIACHLVSPSGKGLGGYTSNSDVYKLISKIEKDGLTEIKDQNKLEIFKKTISQFKHDIKNSDTNNDTVDTYLHKLRDLFDCYDL